jgi:hypothetical protein
VRSEVAPRYFTPGLQDLLAEGCTFHSPFLHKPQQGKGLSALYLGAAFHVFFDHSFRYARAVVGERDAVLEFSTEIDGLAINGVDMVHWNEAGQIAELKVMLRPLKAVNPIHQQMAAML